MVEISEEFNLAAVLANFDEELLANYLHELIDYWLQIRKLRYNKYIKYLDIENWWKLEENFERIAKLFINNDTTQLQSDINGLKDGHKSQINVVLSLRRNDLIEYFKTKTSNLNNNFMNDLDWIIKLSLSSNKVAKLNEKHCSIKFYTDDVNQEDVSFEVSKEELDKLLTTLETIQKVVNTY